MPKSRSKRRQYQPPPRPRPKPSGPWLAPTSVTLLLVGVVYLVLFYAGILPWGEDDSLGNYNLLIGFVPLITGMIMLTRWR
ncbi:MAG TPA: cell division protein CrgA [Actinomycetes bacterium]|nr:cell division protein CrgA [Actinomycetes bacterium]